MRRNPKPTSLGLVGWASRHRMVATFLLLFLMASPARPVDDRQLLQANAGAKAWVLLIMDSSHSMNDEFSDTYRLPAYMDDFVYPQNAGPTSYGSKIALAKSVIRDVITKSESGSGINWAFSYYRNPNQILGAADYSLGTAPDFKDAGTPIGGAKNANDYLENGGLEWLYFAQCASNAAGSCTGTVASALDPNLYPDITDGRFLQFGHKVMRNYYLDSRPPFSGTNNNGGTWRGAFGPHGLSGANRGTVIYRNTAAPNTELRMSVLTGNYGDPFMVVKIDVFAPPAAATPTITNTPSITVTQTPTGTPTATKTPPPATVTKTATNTPIFTATRDADANGLGDADHYGHDDHYENPVSDGDQDEHADPQRHADRDPDANAFVHGDGHPNLDQDEHADGHEYGDRHANRRPARRPRRRPRRRRSPRPRPRPGRRLRRRR